MAKLHEMKRAKAALVTKMSALVAKEEGLADGETLTETEQSEFGDLKDQVDALNARIGRVEDVMAVQGEAAVALDTTGDGGEDSEKAGRVGVRKAASVPAAPAAKIEKGAMVGAFAKMMVAGGGSLHNARQEAKDVYGESHPVTKALLAGTGNSGGFIVPPDYVAEIIELLRPQTVVRSSNPRTLAMPRGTLTLPRQTQSATAGYGSENAPIGVSQPGVGQIVATYKKMTALVPVSNDLLRYADPSADAMVRDDLVQVMARREDLAFIRGDGTEGSPRGLRSFVIAGNIVVSNPVYTLGTAAMELGDAINRLESGNVPIINPVWKMSPRSKNYLLNVQNSLGVYVYRDEMQKGTLLGYPFKTTTQIPNNLTVGGNSDCSEIYLTEMTQALLLDSMALELGVSREASYKDTDGNLVHTFQQDQSLVRAIAEHDFQMRHEEAVVVITGVRWRPAIA